MTRSLRARNPSVRVANSIYDQPDRTSTRVTQDAMSMVAPSELEFEFDDMVINSQAYRRVMAYAKAKTKPSDPQTEDSLGDLIDLTDRVTIGEGGTATAELPAVFQELQDLTIHEPPTQRQTAGSGVLPSAEPLSATGGLVNDTTMVVAEPGEALTTSPMGHSRSTTPTQLDCKTQIARKFFPLDNIFLCETDFFRRLDLLCSACGKALRGSYVSDKDRKYHIDHFTCEAPGCQFVFGPDDPFYEHENGHYCHFHYCHMHYVERKDEGTLQHWHPTCWKIDKYWCIRMTAVTRSRLERTAAGWTDKLGNPLGPGVLEQVLESVSHDIRRIWSAPGKFEETYAKHLLDMAEALSNSRDFTSFTRPARALLGCTAMLYWAIQHAAEPRKLQNTY
ncbi:hypothetical protein NEMBOFW57_003531 [Staphylotrichum longicolle]|uniref:LIM zinc-binding domain-containing protein n=1 Tax=Staphylotrichum longicolle TaxID=669026 RepID=A0AAD4F6D8_9PEZI|nr:hypothetical protein NEMBOFW57_003531 [Staphylotrichum longicolle]